MYNKRECFTRLTAPLFSSFVILASGCQSRDQATTASTDQTSLIGSSLESTTTPDGTMTSSVEGSESVPVDSSEDEETTVTTVSTTSDSDITSSESTSTEPTTTEVTTAQATATVTPVPTQAPSPTPLPTATPAPTSTALPTSTPLPTATPVQTSSQAPTLVPTTQATTTTPTTTAPTTVEPSGYGHLSNQSEGWSYTAGQPGHQDMAASIDGRRGALLAKYNAIWQLPQAGQKVVYLTMDEGYEYGTNTTRILDIAKAKQVKLSFFLTGHYIESQPALVQRMVAEGHQLANHTDKHLVQPGALAQSVATLQNDIINVNSKFRALTGRDMAKYMRPPTGAWSERSLAVARDLGYTTVFWSFAYRDWLVDAQPNPDQAYDFIMAQLYPGSILLIHAVSTTNVEILGLLIDGIRARGYEIRTLP